MEHQVKISLSIISNPDHPQLRQKATPAIPGPELEALGDAMLRFIRDDKNNAIGLAGSQIAGHGEPVAIVACWVAGRALVMANPEIIDTRGTQRMLECCLSVDAATVKGFVLRPQWVKVRYQHPKTGEWMFAKAQKLMAACICHEIDHLNGVLFTDRIARRAANA